MTNPSTSPVQSSAPIGEYAEIDGRRVWIHKSGGGDGPAVVFLPGASAVGLDYYGIQRRVAEFTTAVIYDRGGSGFSDPMPLPRTAEAVATELRELLRSQGVEGPYILVPHSLGGAYAQRFAQLYPQDVAGMVWVDAFDRNWDDFVPAEAGLAAGEEMAPTREQLEGALPFMREMVAAAFSDYPDDVREAVVDYHVSDTWITVGIAERASTTRLADEVRAGGDLPDTPIIALTPVAVDPAQQALMSEETMREVHDGKVRNYQTLVDSVTDGEHRILDDANHTDIIFKRGDAVVQAVQDVAALAKR